MEKVKVVQTFAEAVALAKKRDFNYIYIPQYFEDLPIGPRNVSCRGVPRSAVADFIMAGYKVTMDKDKCTKCGACWVCCFLGVIRQTEDGYFEIDHEYCRPCGICAQVCPVGAIEFTTESSGADTGGNT
jgi:2-oxoacid:acceptor oxidoreductase delta subunit (pyruvate/2-ketoisovalerate family)